MSNHFGRAFPLIDLRRNLTQRIPGIQAHAQMSIARALERAGNFRFATGGDGRSRFSAVINHLRELHAMAFETDSAGQSTCSNEVSATIAAAWLVECVELRVDVHHEHWPPQARREPKHVGSTKGLEMVKVARGERRHFYCATSLHKAREMPRGDFRREIASPTERKSRPSRSISRSTRAGCR